VQRGIANGDYTICHCRKAHIRKELLTDLLWFRGRLPAEGGPFSRPLKVDTITLACEIELGETAEAVLEEFVKLTAVRTTQHLIVVLAPERWTKGTRYSDHVEEYSQTTFNEACASFRSLTPGGTGDYAAVSLIPPPGRTSGQWHNRVCHWNS
jgi:hypothetical protein